MPIHREPVERLLTTQRRFQGAAGGHLESPGRRVERLADLRTQTGAGADLWPFNFPGPLAIAVSDPWPVFENTVFAVVAAGLTTASSSGVVSVDVLIDAGTTVLHSFSIPAGDTLYTEAVVLNVTATMAAPNGIQVATTAIGTDAEGIVVVLAEQ